MRVKGLIWLGTRTDRFDEMVWFVGHLLGLGEGEGDGGVVEWHLEDGSSFEVFGPEDPGGGHPETGAVAGLEVDDVANARDELLAAGVEISDLQQSGDWRWAYFRAPDGSVYEIVQRG